MNWVWASLLPLILLGLLCGCLYTACLHAHSYRDSQTLRTLQRHCRLTQDLALSALLLICPRREDQVGSMCRTSRTHQPVDIIDAPARVMSLCILFSLASVFAMYLLYIVHVVPYTYNLEFKRAAVRTFDVLPIANRGR